MASSSTTCRATARSYAKPARAEVGHPGDARKCPVPCHRQRVHDPDRPWGARWLHLVVPWGIWNAFKLILNGTISLFRLVRAIMRERMVAQAVRPQDRRRVATNSRC